jgi:hypothetical protein
MPDTLIDRVRAANPARTEEFAGLDHFDGLDLEPRAKRPRRRLLALPVAGLAAIAAAAFLLLPASAPQAREVMLRAVNAMAVDDGGILYAQMRVSRASGEDYGTRRVWVRGPDARFQQLSGTGDAPAGTEEITHDGVIVRYDAAGKKVMTMKGGMVAGEIFRSAALLEAAQGGSPVKLEETTLAGRNAYALSWEEPSGPPHHPKIEMTLWVDRETYVPLQFTDHSYGLDVEGKQFDETLTETVSDFQRLPDTPENRRLLEYGGK